MKAAVGLVLAKTNPCGHKSPPHPNCLPAPCVAGQEEGRVPCRGLLQPSAEAGWPPCFIPLLQSMQKAFSKHSSSGPEVEAEGWPGALPLPRA